MPLDQAYEQKMLMVYKKFRRCCD